MTRDEMKQFREALGLTQTEFGARLGITEQTYRHIEAGHRALNARVADEVTLWMATEEAKGEERPLNDAQQSWDMGVKIGDTIISHETYPDGSWDEVHLMLLWRGQEVCVWHAQVTYRDGASRDLGESASWGLQERVWKKA